MSSFFDKTKCKNGNEIKINLAQIEDEVNVVRVKPKAGKASVLLRIGMVKEVRGMERGSMVSDKHH